MDTWGSNESSWLKCEKNSRRACDFCGGHENIAHGLGSYACKKCFDEKYPLRGGWKIHQYSFDGSKTFVPSVGWEVADDWVMELLQPPEEHWYFLTWTLAPHGIFASIKEQMLKMLDKNFDWKVVEYVEETGGRKGRRHYHMRVKCGRKLRHKYLENLEVHGHINFKRISPQTDDNWSGTLQKYMTKENEIKDLIAESRGTK